MYWWLKTGILMCKSGKQWKRTRNSEKFTTWLYWWLWQSVAPVDPIKNLPVNKNEVTNPTISVSEATWLISNLETHLDVHMGKNWSSITDSTVKSQYSSVEDCVFQRAVIVSPIPHLLCSDLDILPIESKNLTPLLLYLGWLSDLLEQ